MRAVIIKETLHLPLIIATAQPVVPYTRSNHTAMSVSANYQ
jgi:hypothetical protein